MTALLSPAMGGQRFLPLLPDRKLISIYRIDAKPDGGQACDLEVS
jgi:hypothetical protein